MPHLIAFLKMYIYSAYNHQPMEMGVKLVSKCYHCSPPYRTSIVTQRMTLLSSCIRLKYIVNRTTVYWCALKCFLLWVFGLFRHLHVSKGISVLKCFRTENQLLVCECCFNNRLLLQNISKLRRLPNKLPSIDGLSLHIKGPSYGKCLCNDFMNI